MAGGHRRRPRVLLEALAIEGRWGPRRGRPGPLQPGLRRGRRGRLRRRLRAVRREPGAGPAGGGRAGRGPSRVDAGHPGPRRRGLGPAPGHRRAGRGQVAPDRGPPPDGRRPRLAGRGLRPRGPPGRRPGRHRRGPAAVPRGRQPHGHRLGHPRPVLPGPLGGPLPRRGPPGRRRRFPARPGRRQAAPRLPRRLRRRPRGRGPGPLPEDVAEAAWEEGRRLSVDAALARRHPAAPDADRPAAVPLAS